MKLKKSNVVSIRRADKNHQVVSVNGGDKRYMKKPCPDCPWRKDAVGEFPASAFQISAPTSYDMSDRMFGCHSAGTENPKTCAGFLLRGSQHNLSVRLHLMAGEIELDEVSDGGHELFDNYREMAIANGVNDNDPVLKDSRID